jgi:multiple sugar transport system ATP-binding protein
MAEVVLEKLVKTYADKDGREVRAVDGIDLEVADREFMVLVGPSGCGKTTTLRMIAGLEEITAGTIRIGGRTVNGVLPKDRDIAMVFQNYALYPHMSVYENMAFGLRMRDFPKREIEGRVREAAALLGLEAYLERKPKALSGGQRQRVALGRAIVRKPQVFLFDEPLSNLDAKMRVQMRMELAKLRSRLEATVIYVTHDQVEAMTMGDRICVMNQGRIEQVDRPMALYARPRTMFVGGFIGSPPMNFFRGKIVGNAFEAGGWTIGVSGRLGSLVAGKANAEVALGIRPEHIRDGNGGGGGQVRARVEFFEPLGAEGYLHARVGETSFVSKVPASGEYPRDSEVSLTFDLHQARLFDPDSGASLDGSAGPI